MTSSGNNGPHTPDKKTLLGAFRSLTTARTKSPTPSSTSSAAALMPVQVAFARQQSALITNPLTRLTRSSGGKGGGASDDSIDNPIVATLAESVVGGPSGLGKLLDQLKPERTISDRISAADGICVILDQYPVNNVLAIWTVARDLLEDDYTTEASKAGYRLLATCVKQPALTALERSTFFEAISSSEDQGDFDVRFDILKDLTNNGKNVEALEISIAPFLAKSLDSSFDAVSRARKRERNSSTKSELRLKEESSLNQLFSYIIELTKFNSKVLTEEDIVALLAQVVTICKRTTSESDIEKAIRAIGALITYTYVPEKSLKSCAEVLCDVYRQLKGLKEQAWSTLGNLFRSHLGQLAVSELLTIVRNDHERSQLNILRGAVHVLQKLVILNGADGLPKVSLSLLFPALLEALKVDYRKLDADILQFITTILADGNLTRLVLEEDDCWYLSEILLKCARPLDTSSKVDSVFSDISSRDTPTTFSKTTDSIPNGLSEALSRILDALNELVKDMDFVQRSSIMAVFMRLADGISNEAASTVISYCAEERLLSPSNENWLESSKQLIDAILMDQSRPSQLRLGVLDLLKETYSVIQCMGECSSQEFVEFIVDCIRSETDAVVLEELVDFLVNASSHASESTFALIIKVLRESIFDRKQSSGVMAPSLSFWASSAMPASQLRGSMGNILTKGVVRMFIRAINQDADKALTIFALLIEIAKSKSGEADARISALKLLSRLRSDSNNAVYLISTSESQNLAASLCRTVETAHFAYAEDNTRERQGRGDEHGHLRNSRTASGGSPHNSLNRSTQRSATGLNRPAKASLPLWMYPGPYGLPEEPSPLSSHLLSSSNMESSAEASAPSLLPIGDWLDFAIHVLESGADWEIYSYVLVHLGAQLSNLSLFASDIERVKRLRSLLSEQVKNTSYQEPPSSTGLRKADVAICIFHMLSVLIGYRTHFKKDEQDDLVKLFLLGIGSGDRTSRSCIHALSVCCHELPNSISKSIEHILHKMSQIITQSQVAVHILEFLAGLARLYDLYKNFRDEEYRTVFGICSRYLQYARDQREKGQVQRLSRTSHGTLRHSGASRDFGAISEQEPGFRLHSTSEDLPQYVYALAYHVITFWFMSLKLQDRPRHMEWIAKNLVYSDQSGKEVLEDQGLVTIDMMHRVAYTDRDDTTPDPNFAKPSDGEISTKSWVVGMSLMTIETAARTGVSQITRRRPSCTRYSVYRPQLSQPPRHQVPLTTGLAAEVFYTSSYIGILPEDIFQEFYSPVNSSPGTNLFPEIAIPLPDDEATRRAISMFDRNMTVDCHKVGVIYIGYDQEKESDILANVAGSPRYNSFLEGLGTLTKLKGAAFNTQGLDHDSDFDGEFTYCWRDRVTEIVFHVTTLMPTHSDDPHCTNKKRHIGNDYVNIVYNDSGMPFKFDTFPSAFNSVYIVITPEARASFREAPKQSVEPTKEFLKVQVLSKPGFPEISPAAETKVIGANNLSTFVRLLALNASVFSLVWANREGGEHVSSWRNRLREIRRLRERYGDQVQSHAGSASSPTPPSTGYSGAGSLSQGFSSPPGTRESTGFRRTSAATFVSESTNRSSILSNATEMERQSSDYSRV